MHGGKFPCCNTVGGVIPQVFLIQLLFYRQVQKHPSRISYDYFVSVLLHIHMRDGKIKIVLNNQ